MQSLLNNDALRVPSSQSFHSPLTQIGIVQSSTKVQGLESELKALSAASHTIQARIRVIKKQLKEEKVWSVPIHRLSLEVLSEIFVAHARMQWDAPLVDGAVCRRWRDLVLDVQGSRVWSYIRIDLLTKRGLSKWFKRCRDNELHVGSTGADVPILYSNPDFTTLTLDNVSPGTFFPFMLSHPKLHTLQLRQATQYYKFMKRLTGFNGFYLDTSFIDVTRFSKLVTLHIDSIDDPLLSWLIGPSNTDRPTNFPPIKHLVISKADGTSITRIVDACRESLLQLEIGFHGIPSIPSGRKPTVVHLPALQHLAYQIATSFPMSNNKSKFPIHFKTPSLRSYHESQSHFPSPLHRDTYSVSQLWLQSCVSGTPNPYVPDVYRFPSVETIVTDFDASAFKGFSLLLQFEKRSCPNLAVCHYYSTSFKRTWSEPLDTRGKRSKNPSIVHHPDSLPRKHIKFSPIVGNEEISE